MRGRCGLEGCQARMHAHMHLCPALPGMGPFTSCHGAPHLMPWAPSPHGPPHLAWARAARTATRGTRTLLWIQAPPTLDPGSNDSGSMPQRLWIQAPPTLDLCPNPGPGHSRSMPTRDSSCLPPPPLPGNPARVSVETRVKMKWSICRPGDKGRGSRMGTTNCHGHPGYRVKWRLAGWLIGWLVGLWEAGRW